jgi:hypothetical protein
MPFDHYGRCTGPETLKELMGTARKGEFSDTFGFSHGWNNDWKTATTAYAVFIHGFMQLCGQLDLSLPEPFRPLLVGVFWPSIILLTSDENAPQIASQLSEATAPDQLEVERIGDQIDDDAVERYYELVQRGTLTREEVVELAQLITPANEQHDDPLDDLPPADRAGEFDFEAVADLLDTQSSSIETADFGAFGTGNSMPKELNCARTGDFVRRILPRDALRALTVYRMKDRAGVVGARGVGQLLVELLAACSSRVHLIGHSYGAKVMLSATCFPSLSRQVESMLLLQPAVSHLCFADVVPGRDRHGGYNAALRRVRRPILSTFSQFDFPLTHLFHLGGPRCSDLGELAIATTAEPPSLYAALGGYGPRGAGESLVPIVTDTHTRYELGPIAPRVYGLDGGVIATGGNPTIKHHGDISNTAIWWALYNLVADS